MIKHIVKHNENNKNIERIILSNYDVDKNTLYKALRKRDIKINGKRVSENILVYENDVIEAYINLKATYEVVFENEYVLIVNKKQGVPVTPDKNNERCLLEIINHDFNAHFDPCHRIDRNTGGLVIFSKQKHYTDIIKQAINDRYFKKIYKCIVFGNAENLIGLHKAWHFKDSDKNKVFIYKDKRKYCKEIITEIIKASYDSENNITEIYINLLTGRTHQIRSHLAFLGHPIIGDGKYGYNDTNRAYGLKYQALWAVSLIPDKIQSSLKEILPSDTLTVIPKYE